MLRVLIAVTSCDRQGAHGPFTGYELREVSHPYLIFRDQGYEVDFVSPAGGNPPIEKYLLSDPISRAFLEDEDAQQRIRTSYRPNQLRAGDYAAIFFAGGQGALWDLADCHDLQELAAEIYQRGGVVGACCQGLSGLLNIKLANGAWLLKGKRIHSQGMIPAAFGALNLEARLQERGALGRRTVPLATPVMISGRLVTTQEPLAAEGVAAAMVALIEQEQPLETTPVQTIPSGQLLQHPETGRQEKALRRAG